MATVKSAATRLADRYLRCDDFAARIDGVELSPDVWAVFAQLARARTAAEIAQLLALDVEAVNAAIRRLVRRKLVRKHVVAWRDYAATAQSVAGAPATPKPSAQTNQPSASASVSQLSALNSQLPSTPSAPPFYVTSAASASVSQLSALNSQLPPPSPTPRSPIISLRIASSTATPRPAPAVSLRIEPPSPTTPPAPSAAPATPAANSTTDGLRLRPVLDAIGAKAGGGVAGQLLVYRVFLQIPTELMQAAGLHSLSLVDDRFTLRHPELRAALAETARRHAGVDIESLAAAV